MLFDTLDFAIFLPIVFAIYWRLNNADVKYQNVFLILASYVFYGWWDWRFLALIVFSSTIDFILARSIYKSDNQKSKKKLLGLSIVVNLGLLGVFKYFNFFIDNLESAFSLLGNETIFLRLDWVLPVGISFYTFQTMSYTIDVYRGKLDPARDIFSFFAYVSFFPQLVAGPIERATQFLPQFVNRRRFDYLQAVDGLRQILWGLFKKIVIADNCATYVDMFFADPTAYSGSALLLGAIFFAFQIYGDFSGYSDIAIGLGKLFGFKLIQNFAFPYFSRDIAEFWRRWHISLSTWFRDYLYIPLGGSRGSKLMTLRNIFIVFIVCGFWHGANWTFIVWGILNAALYIPLYVLDKNRSHLDVVAQGKRFPSISESIKMLFTFGATVMLWIVFRSDTMMEAIHYVGYIFSQDLFSIPDFSGRGTAGSTVILIGLMLLVEWQAREGSHGLHSLLKSQNRVVRLGFYFVLVFLIGMYGSVQSQDFIYFQF